MSRLRINIAANYVGSGYAALLSLFLVPFYLRMLGAEAYGLVGLFVSFRAMAGILDLGLSTSAGREVAARAARTSDRTSIPWMVRTIEVVYWGVGLALGAALYLLSDFLATRWVHVSQLTSQTVSFAIGIFSATLAASWPIGLYKGVLRGFERQVTHNVVVVTMATFRGGGALAVLYFFSPTVSAFLAWQFIAGVVEVVTMAALSWQTIRHQQSATPAFAMAELRQIWRLAAGISGVSILAIVSTQLDKLFISKLLPMSELGYYTVVSSLSAASSVLVGPVTAAIFPRLTAALSSADSQALEKTYHRATKFVAFLVAPVGGMLGFFGHDVLMLWTQSAEVADHAHLALAWLAIAAAVGAISTMPYALQIAAGMARLPLMMNLVSVVFLLPAVYLAVPRWGITGAAGAVALNSIVYYVAAPLLTHRLLLKGQALRWLFDNSLPFLMWGFCIFGFFWFLAQLIGASLLERSGLCLLSATLYVGVTYYQHRDIVNQNVKAMLARRSEGLAQ